MYFTHCMNACNSREIWIQRDENINSKIHFLIVHTDNGGRDQTKNNLSSGPTHAMYTPTILTALIILEFILLFNF